jgi:hypothetical protein
LPAACARKAAGHALVGLLRQSVFGRLAGYEGVNDAERLCRDPAMRWVVGDRRGMPVESAFTNASHTWSHVLSRLHRAGIWGILVHT